MVEDGDSGETHSHHALERSVSKVLRRDLSIPFDVIRDHGRTASRDPIATEAPVVRILLLKNTFDLGEYQVRAVSKFGEQSAVLKHLGPQKGRKPTKKRDVRIRLC